MVRVERPSGPARGRGGDGDGRKRQADATAFWALYNTRGKEADVPVEVAKALAGTGEWAAACAEMVALIARATP